MSPSDDGSAIVGRVRGADGAPIAEATVAFGGDSPPHRDIAALTDAVGRFRFGGLAAGRYTVIVHAEGHAPASAEVEAGPGEVAEAEIVLERG